MLLGVDCLPNAVGKQPSILHTLDLSWKKMDVKLRMMTTTTTMILMMMTMMNIGCNLYNVFFYAFVYVDDIVFLTASVGTFSKIDLIML